MNATTPSIDYIAYICSLYGDIYDDRIEDFRPPTAGNKQQMPGSDWAPGECAAHKSLVVFQKELEAMGIKLSSSKIRKILITGGCWTTERSREIGKLFDLYIRPVSEGGKGFKRDEAIGQIASELNISTVTVSVDLPYRNVVYKLDNKSSNAKRCGRYRERKRLKMKR